jgi:hypothetical protein
MHLDPRMRGDDGRKMSLDPALSPQIKSPIASAIAIVSRYGNATSARA